MKSLLARTPRTLSLQSRSQEDPQCGELGGVRTFPLTSPVGYSQQEPRRFPPLGISRLPRCEPAETLASVVVAPGLLANGD